MILNLGPPIAVQGASYTTFVVGLHGTWGTTEFVDSQRGIELRLTPHGAHRLLRIPPGGLADSVVELPLLDRLAARLAAGADWATRLDSSTRSC